MNKVKTKAEKMIQRGKRKRRIERRIERIGRQLCALDRRLEKIAMSWNTGPYWTDSFWTRRQNNRWADAAGKRSALAAELMRLGRK